MNPAQGLHKRLLRHYRSRYSRPPTRGGDGSVDVVVKGRHTEITDRFRAHTKDKLAKIAKLDGRC